MKQNFCVPVQPVGKVNVIVANVAHDKHRKQVTLYMHPGENDKTLTIHIMSGKGVKLGDMPRLNTKKVEGLMQLAENECKAKSGELYNHVVAFAAEKGLTII